MEAAASLAAGAKGTAAGAGSVEADARSYEPGGARTAGIESCSGGSRNIARNSAYEFVKEPSVTVPRSVAGAAATGAAATGAAGAIDIGGSDIADDGFGGGDTAAVW